MHMAHVSLLIVRLCLMQKTPVVPEYEIELTPFVRVNKFRTDAVFIQVPQQGFCLRILHTDDTDRVPFIDVERFAPRLRMLFRFMRI